MITCLPVCASAGQAVLPSPTYSWTLDGVVVVRDVSLLDRTAVVFDDDFLMLEGNALLFMIQPVPIMVTPSLNIVVDFTAYNVSTIVNRLPGGGTGDDDIRTHVLESILGKWQCTAHNVFGNDVRTSVATGED